MQHPLAADGQHAREDALLEAGAEHDRVVFFIHVRTGGENEDQRRRRRRGRALGYHEPNVEMCESGRYVSVCLSPSLAGT